MLRNVDLKEISDGKLYTANDMVKAGCGTCQGCSSCCETMADTIVLDPLDVFWMSSWLGYTFEQLLTDHIELKVVDGMILPHIKINGLPARCSFLNEAGLCDIHEARPGFCRLFPLGRYYEDGGFQYFLQTRECKKTNRTKVKIRKWIDTPDFDKYEAFVRDWHYYLKDFQAQIRSCEQGLAFAKQVNMFILETFYQKAFDKNMDFYEQFYARLLSGRQNV